MVGRTEYSSVHCIMWLFLSCEPDNSTWIFC